MSGSRDIDLELIRAIEAALADRAGRPERNEIRFLCPVHDDHHPSARWNGRKAVWRCDVCGAGAGALDLARRLGIAVAEGDRQGLTLAQLADAKGCLRSSSAPSVSGKASAARSGRSASTSPTSASTARSRRSGSG